MGKKKYVAGFAVLAMVIGAFIWWPNDNSSSKERSGADPSGISGSSSTRAATKILQKARGAIYGSLKNNAGEVPQQGRVCLRTISKDLASSVTDELRCVNADAGGDYRFEGLFPVKYAVYASAPNYLPTAFLGEKQETNFPLSEGEEKQIDFVLTKGGTRIQGIVKDQSGGVVPGALVSVSFKKSVASTFSDDDGHFELWTGEGMVGLSANAAGYTEGQAWAQAPGPEIELLLMPESVLRGQVIEKQTRKPVPSAKVTVSYTHNASYGSTFYMTSANKNAFTDSEGMFEIQKLAPGRYSPQAIATNQIGYYNGSFQLGLGEVKEGVVIETIQAARISGTLKLASQTPCAEDSISLNHGIHGESSSTDEQGQFTFPAVLPGAYQIETWCDDAINLPEPKKLTVGQSDITELHIEVKEGLSITGRIVDEQGNLLPKAGASASPVKRNAGMTRGDRNCVEPGGTLKCNGLAPGEYVVSAYLRGYINGEKKNVSLIDGNVDLGDIVLRKGGSISGHVYDQDGTPLPKVSVVPVGDSSDSWGKQQMTLTDGSFQLLGLSDGRYDLMVLKDWRILKAPGASEKERYVGEATVKNGSEETVRLIVSNPTGNITGKVVDENGAPVTDAFVYGSRQSDRPGQSRKGREAFRWMGSLKPALTNMDGEFTLNELREGTYSIMAQRKGGGDAIAEDIPLRGTVTLTIKQTGTISGTLSSRGALPTSFSITVSDSAAKSTVRSEDFIHSGGSWAMHDLPAGQFVLTAIADNGSGRTKVSLGVGESKSGIAISLQQFGQVKGRLVDAETGTPVEAYGVTAETSDETWSSPWREEKLLTSADGTFFIEKVPAGPIVLASYPIDRDYSKLGYGTIRGFTVSVLPGQITDAGDIKVFKQKATWKNTGDLGVITKQDGDGHQTRILVTEIHEDGPAAATDLAVDDEIIAVNGHTVSGNFSYHYSVLTRVPPGTVVSFETKTGKTVQITAVKRER